ncbi:hypothetical protein [Sediminibacterium ginsengisoli]|uniref:Chain length determinant protein n=1 Tax=Sediminibacterium ginsengisoli TaxID=413434 RepID=A0A1T4N430_9BACT|nr:hypothetical protein [Sediminibacterium ginsengisoli]SJZ73894.1 Chain length determinant protein [Sediminibacterium ginsengisoli]
MQQPEPINLPEDEAYSLQSDGLQLLSAAKQALSFRKLLFLAGILGAVLGVAYYFWKPVTYTARISFVVEDTKASGSGLMSALAGQFGLDLGNITGGSGILSGDNILELLKSRSLIKKTLLTPADSTSSRSLADVYADSYGWKKKWEQNSKVNKLVQFPPGKESYGRIEDSLLQRIVKNILEKELSVVKIDRKLSFIEMQSTMRDEQLSISFCQRLLKTATDFYIETKTRRLTKNIQRLQAKADSLERSLNKKTYSAADASRLLLDANPAYAAPEVTAEISSRDKYVQSTIYGEIIKNLEINKTAQIQETPTIQVVDNAEIPLKKNKTSALAAVGGGFFLAVFITFLLLTARFVFFGSNAASRKL